MSRTLHFLLVNVIAILMVGCKLAVIVVEGGEVQSVGSGTCTSGSTCVVEVTDTNFSETFTAVPNEGWHFHGWISGDNFFCGGSINGDCTLSFDWYSEFHPYVESLVASSEIFYLMPVFKEYPIYPKSSLGDEPRSIWVNGELQQWLQPADFTGYTFDQISSVCPNGACTGSLPGSTFDLTGYTWASIMEVSTLFNAYGVNPPFTAPFQSRVDDKASLAMAQDFEVSANRCFGDCPVSFVLVIGMVRDQAESEWLTYRPYAHLDNCAQKDGGPGCFFSNTHRTGDGPGDDDEYGLPLPDEDVGAWFWRPATD